MKLPIAFFAVALSLYGPHAAPAQDLPAGQRHRVILITDAGGDPADSQNIVRFLLYSNEFDVEGMIAASSWWVRPGWPPPRNEVHPEIIQERIEAYGKVRENLLKHAKNYPTNDYLLSRVAASTNGYGMEGVGDGLSTPASKLIISVVERPDPRPVYIVVNGGSNALAQALWDYRKAHREAEVDTFVSRLRVFDNTGQDDAGAWMCHEFPNLFYVRSATQSQCFMGPSGPDGIEPFDGPRVWGRSQLDWIEANVRNDHGPLGSLYPQRMVNGRFLFMEGGGAALWLGLAHKGLSDPEQPAWGGWGGRFTSGKRFDVTAAPPRVWETEHKWRHWSMYEEAADVWSDGGTVFGGTCAPLWRWRQAYLNDFQGRMDWCVKDYKDANHNPVAAFRGDLGDAIVRLKAKPSERIPLDASASRDPDNDALEFRWFVYPEAGTYRGAASINRDKEKVAELVVPQDAAGKQIHVILEVKDLNPIVSMFGFRRIVIDVE